MDKAILILTLEQLGYKARCRASGLTITMDKGEKGDTVFIEPWSKWYGVSCTKHGNTKAKQLLSLLFGQPNGCQCDSQKDLYIKWNIK